MGAPAQASEEEFGNREPTRHVQLDVKGKNHEHQSTNIHPVTEHPRHQGIDGLHSSGVIRVATDNIQERASWNYRVRTGKAVRLLPGCYLTAEAWNQKKRWEQYRMLCIAAALKYPTRFLALGAAAALLNIPLPRTPEGILLASPTSRRSGTVATINPRHRVLHKVRTVPVGEVVLSNGIATTSLAWTATSIAANVRSNSEAGTALMVLEGALRSGISIEDLKRCAVTSDGKPRGPALAKWIDLADERSDSPAESLMRAILFCLGIDYEQQVLILDERSHDMGRVDFLLTKYGIIIEVDGAVKYDGTFGDPYRALKRERIRHNRITNLGYQVLRISWQQMHNGEAYRMIQAAVDSAKASPRRTRGKQLVSRLRTIEAPDGSFDRHWL